MKPLLILGAPLALAACAQAPDLITADAIAPATNSNEQIRHIHGPALLNEYNPRPVTGPDNWRKLNDKQSPAAGES